MIVKRKPKKDKKLLELIRMQRCLACHNSPSEADHITTRGAGGSDTEENVWPLCTKHHYERHKKGLGYMASTYAGCFNWLQQTGREDVLDRIMRMKK